MRLQSFDAFRDEQLRAEEFRRDYESMEPEFSLAREVPILRYAVSQDHVGNMEP